MRCTERDRFSVEGKTILLTGAAGGVGAALLRGFLEAGARVLAVTRTPVSDWNGLETWGALRPFAADLGDAAELARLIDFCAKQKEPLDVLVNNAGISLTPPQDNLYSVEILNETMSVNFEAAWRLCGAIAPLMASRGGGSIINVTSINAEAALPGNPAYIASKAALRMLTKSLARDFGHLGVRANNLCPGYVHTKMTSRSHADPLKYEERKARTMLGRWAEPEDLVGPCIFLASDASAYITGADIHVDGGWLAKGL